MKGFNSWAQGIIIAIIATSILQMILPDNKNKKYINVVVGIYILFCIISPVIGKDFNLENIDVDEYITIENSTNKEDTDVYNESIGETFKDKIIYNIKSQLKSKGYEAKNINISIDDKYNITKIVISDVYESKEKSKSNDTDSDKKEDIYINKIETNINTVDINIEEKPIKRNVYKW